VIGYQTFSDLLGVLIVGPVATQKCQEVVTSLQIFFILLAGPRPDRLPARFQRGATPHSEPDAHRGKTTIDAYARVAVTTVSTLTAQVQGSIGNQPLIAQLSTFSSHFGDPSDLDRDLRFDVVYGSQTDAKLECEAH
jgi:hypothetical protein